MKPAPFIACFLWLVVTPLALAQETFLPLEGNQAPSSHRELWAGFDPRREPLETEVLREWEEEGVVLRIVRFRIGIFRGQKAIMAAIYGFPQGAARVPGLVQIHGGGQYADYRAVLSNAKRGYATLSIAWAGRMNAPEYRVAPKEVALFWEGATSDPSYRLTTDWGLLDAYHAPSRNPKNAFASISPAAWTLDAVASPRNNPWFLCTVGARRALTFLEEQGEVDAARLGVYGHSMGGKITVLTAGADPRVKAAAPSCGGVSDRNNGEILYQRTIGDDVSLGRITCPIVFLSPANDFHGRIDDLQTALNEIQSTDWRLTCSPHHNHQDTASYEVATQLWFDEHLRSEFEFPGTPKTLLTLVPDSGVPLYRVQPDRIESVLAVDIYYTQQGQVAGDPNDRENTIARFWRHASATRTEDGWMASLPLFRTDKPLWVYANVVYPLTRPIRGAGYYYGAYETDQFNVSSTMSMLSPSDLKKAGVRRTLEKSLAIESFEGEWEKEWFTYRQEEWSRRTHKIYDPQWAAPGGARLSFEVRCDQANLLVVRIDGFACERALSGGPEWQRLSLAVSAFTNVRGEPLQGWQGIKELSLAAMETLRQKVKGSQQRRTFGGPWDGSAPEFRDLRWSID